MMPLVKSDKSSEEIISMMSSHVNDAGVIISDKQMLIQVLAEIRNTNQGSHVAERIKRGEKKMAWRTLDSEILSDLLKRKI